jgi:hypothetical protein
MEAFVYCRPDRATNKLYVGSHKGSIDDGYVCSSKHMLKEYRERPADFSRQIVAEGTYDEIRAFKSILLTTINAAGSCDFYNRYNDSTKFITTPGSIKKTAATKRLRGDNNPMYGKTHTEEVRQTHSLRMNGERNPNWEREFPESTIKKMSEARKAYWARKKGSI